MASNRQVTLPVPIADLNRMILLLAGTVLATSIAVFCVVDITLHQGVMQALLISVLPNIIASVFIYIAIYFSLSRVDSLRQRAAQQEMVEAITSGIRSIIPAPPAAPTVQAADSAFARQHIRPEQLIVIQRFLDAICNFSTTLSGNLDLRLYCHLADKKEGVLHPVCVARGIARADYDYEADIPFRGPEARVFVVAKAMNQRRVVAEDLPVNHSELYSAELRTRIPANLKCVIAAPIESYTPDVGDGPLGVLAIDSMSANCAELGFTDPSGEISSKFDIMLTSCSRALYQVLTMLRPDRKGLRSVEIRKCEDPAARELCEAARKAAELAYAKYSKFRVGAAVTTASGTVYTAANIENACYGLGLCAERAAIAQAVTSGDLELTRIAVACVDAKQADGINATMPCGACRQWFVEFSPDLEVLILTPGDDIYTFQARDLLAVPFVLNNPPAGGSGD